MHNFTFDKNKIKIIVLILVVFISLIALNFFNRSNENEQSTFPTIPNELSNEEEVVEKNISNEEKASSEIYIDIKGAVLKPDVYKLAEGSRVQDAIQIAGGFLENANQTKINLAARIHDEMVIYVPKIGEEEVEGSTVLVPNENGAQGVNKGGRININTATTEQLQALPGIGPAKAASIIAYREEKGRFEKIEDLVNVSGIGEKSLEKLKDKITIN